MKTSVLKINIKRIDEHYYYIHNIPHLQSKALLRVIFNVNTFPFHFEHPLFTLIFVHLNVHSAS
jgi:hypothetical protein